MQGQNQFEPHLGIMLSAGATAPGGSGWSVPVQLLFVPNSGGQFAPALFDSVRVGRELQRGFALGVGMTWHRTPRFAFGGSLAYIGKPSKQRCTGLGTWKAEPTDQFHPVDEHFNEQLCSSANGPSRGTAIVAFTMSVRYGLATTRVTPYVAVGAGLSFPLQSYVETVGTVTSNDCPNLQASCQVLVYAPERTNVRPLVAPAFGVTLPVAPLAALVLEARDVLTWLPRAEATPVSEPLTRSRAGFSQTLVIQAGLEFAFVTRHARRY